MTSEVNSSGGWVGDGHTVYKSEEVSALFRPTAFGVNSEGVWMPKIISLASDIMLID